MRSVKVHECGINVTRAFVWVRFERLAGKANKGVRKYRIELRNDSCVAAFKYLLPIS